MKKKKVILSVIIALLVLVLMFLSYTLFSSKLYFKNLSKKSDLEVFTKYKEENVEACYGNKFTCHKVKYTTKGTVNYKKIGLYKVSYNINYRNKKLSKIKEVNVIDTKKPTLKVTGVFDNVCPSGKSKDILINAKDNYDGDISNKVTYTIKDDYITYVVSDSSGNKTIKKIKIKINDSEKPTIILKGESIIYLGTSSKYIEEGYKAEDNCDGDITKNVVVSGKVDTSKAGNYTLTYSVKDNFGNSSSVKREVKVYKKNDYNPENVTGSVIYLTFDDGPGPYTAKLLDILKKYNVKATFFVTGYNNNYNDMLKREVDEGHTVALHSYSHSYGTIYTSIDDFMNDLTKIQNKVKDYAGVESKIIRFPGGSSNTVSRKYKNHIMSDLTKKVEELGFRYFDWTIASGDAGETKDTNKIISNVTGHLKPNAANVILQHDIKGFSVDAVESIIQYGLANGYTFAPLTMNSPVVHQKVNN